MTSRAAATGVALTGANQALRAGNGTYYGFSIRETGGAVATVRFYDNASAASGTILETISLASGESAREYYDDGMRISNGLYVQVVTGTVEGSVRIA